MGRVKKVCGEGRSTERGVWGVKRAGGGGCGVEKVGLSGLETLRG